MCYAAPVELLADAQVLNELSGLCSEMGLLCSIRASTQMDLPGVCLSLDKSYVLLNDRVNSGKDHGRLHHGVNS